MKTKSIKNPEITELSNFLDRSLSKKALIIIIADCKIRYNGKTNKKFESRERMIMIKPDGSLIIDHEYGLEPVSSIIGNKFEIKMENNKLYILASNKNSLESIEVEILKGYLASCHIV
ncbi:hypothetical protein [Methanobacterium sp. ACI-7]|uniref:hypothetical protein n=1 Tax=unclassified Methanobacterium TaxID=2627676 RepID=UPI0039C30195